MIKPRLINPVSDKLVVYMFSYSIQLPWTSRKVGRGVGTPIAKDGLLYVGDLGGIVHCLDAATGAHVWTHETNDAIWGSLLLAGDRDITGFVERTIGQVVATIYPPDNMLANFEQVLLLPDGTQRKFRMIELRPAAGVAVEQFWAETRDCRAAPPEAG